MSLLNTILGAALSGNSNGVVLGALLQAVSGMMTT